MESLQALDITKKNGNEPFQIDGCSLPFNLLSFWQWSSSDLVGNALRGVLAEYIVATAVESANGTRTEWDAFDIQTPEGIKIEVKSGAYIQSWEQKKLTTIQFGVRPTKGWDAKANTYSNQKIRQSDVYVFCVLSHKDKETVNPLDLSQWLFYIISTKTLNETVGNQKTITLSRLLQLNPKEVRYGEIYSAIKQLKIGSAPFLKGMSE